MLMNESKCTYTYTRVFVNYSNQNRTFTRQSWCEGGRRKERDEQMPVQPERQTRGMKKREKGCWQTVTGTTLSATRFCAYHSPPIHHRRHRCHPRPIWSDLNLLDPILYSRAPYICRLLLRSSSSLLSPLHNTSLCLRSARVAYFYREDRHVHVPAKERHNYDLGIEQRSDLIVDRSYLKNTQHLWKFPVNSGLIGIDGTSIDGRSILPRTR